MSRAPQIWHVVFVSRQAWTPWPMTFPFFVEAGLFYSLLEPTATEVAHELHFGSDIEPVYALKLMGLHFIVDAISAIPLQKDKNKYLCITFL
jgi:hypothetical protein